MAPSRPPNRRDFEIALICALPLEAGWVEAVFDKFWEDDGGEFGKADGDQNSYTTGVIGEDNVVLAHLPGMGKVSAAAVASSLRISFPEIKLAIVVGICGGVPKDLDGSDIILGDVVISQNLVQYDFGRQYPTVFERKDTFEDAIGRPSPEIRGMLAKAQTPRGRQKLQADTIAYILALREKHPKSKYPGAGADRLYQKLYLHKHHKHPDSGKLTCECKDDGQICADSHKKSCEELDCDQDKLVDRQRLLKVNSQGGQGIDQEIQDVEPMVHFGRIGSGDTVMKSGELRDRLAEADGLIAFEMEGAGVWLSFPSIVVKGVCDYADSHKNKDWQDYAAAAAACLMKALLKQRTSGDGLSGSARSPLPVWHVPFDRLPLIVGREKEIGLVRKRLFHAEESRKAAICGLGGIGKSRVAWEIANQARISNEPCSVFWIQASSVPTFEKDLFDIGRKLQIPGFENEKVDRKLLFTQHLEHQLQGRWLIILDSADDEAIWCSAADRTTDDASLLAYIPKSTTGSILITTRSRRVVAGFAGKNTTHLEHLTPEEAVEVLCSLMIDSDTTTTSQARSDLVKQLAYLPLAIVQAAAYMNFNDVLVSDYLKLLCSKKEDAIIGLLSQNFEDESRYRGAQNAIATTWLISFEAIRHHHYQAMEYLSFMCCLDEKDIPQTLLPELSSEEDAIKTVGILVGYSFISRQDQNSLQITLYSMHRLVRLATRNWLSNQGALGGWVEKTTERVDKVLPHPEYNNKGIWKLYLPHASVLCDTSCDPGFESRFELLAKLGEYACAEGQFTEAIERFSQVVKWRHEHLGDTSQKTLHAFYELGVALTLRGDHEKAGEYGTKASQGLRENFGVDYPLTLESTSKLAFTYSQQGRYKEAERLELDVLERRQRLLGKEHLHTLTGTRNLALIYAEQGRYKEAERLQLEALEILKRVQGGEHPETIRTISNLGLIYLRQGRLEEAERLFLDALETQRRTLGQEHYETLDSVNNLAVTYQKQGRVEEAERLFLDALEIRRRTLGQEHPKTLQSVTNLAVTYQKQGRLEEAERLFLDALETQRRVLGIEHCTTLISMANLAMTYWQEERYEEAERLQRDVLETRKRVLGKEHPETLASMRDLAWTLKSLGRKSKL